MGHAHRRLAIFQSQCFRPKLAGILNARAQQRLTHCIDALTKRLSPNTTLTHLENKTVKDTVIRNLITDYRLLAPTFTRIKNKDRPSLPKLNLAAFPQADALT